MNKTKISLWAVAIALHAVACTSDSKEKSPGPDGGTASDDVDAQLPPGLTLTWRIVEPPSRVGEEVSGTVNVQELPPVAGAKVCVYERKDLPCATTRKDGVFVLGGFKSLEEVVITCNKDGYVGSVRTIEAASTDMDGTANPIFMGKRDTTPLDIGIDIAPSGKGALSIVAAGLADDGGVALTEGSKLSLAPVSGNGPYYAKPNNLIDKSAKATVGGLAFWFNLDEGDYTLTIDDSVHDCAPVSFPFGEYGLPAPPRSTKLKVLADYVSDQAAFLCTAKSVILPTGDAGAKDGG